MRAMAVATAVALFASPLSPAECAPSPFKGSTTTGDSWYVSTSRIFSTGGAALTSALSMPSSLEGVQDVFIVPSPHKRHSPSPALLSPSREGSRRLGALFSSSEHFLLASQASLFGFSDGNSSPTRELGIDIGWTGSNVRVRYGDIIALGGDFFGADDPPVSLAGSGSAASSAWERAVGTLLQRSASAPETVKIMALINKEAGIADAASPSSSAWTSGKMDDMDGAYNRATGGGSFVSSLYPLGRYLDLAMNNEDHFSPGSRTAYTVGHASACAAAAAAKSIADPTARDAALARAYAINAFADHYLTDMFASGHQRVPRVQLGNKGIIGPIGDRLSQHMHDEDNRMGLNVGDGKGRKWTAYGDHMYRDPSNSGNRARVLEAVAASVAEVSSCFASGSAQPGGAMPSYFPQVQNPAGHVPLFKLSPGGRVLRRTKITDPQYNAFTDDWSPTKTLAELEARKHFLSSDGAVDDAEPVLGGGGGDMLNGSMGKTDAADVDTASLENGNGDRDGDSKGGEHKKDTVAVGKGPLVVRLHAVGKGSKVDSSTGDAGGVVQVICDGDVAGQGALGKDGSASVKFNNGERQCADIAVRWVF